MIKNIHLILQKLKIRLVIPTGFYDNAFLQRALVPEWELRIKDVLSCPDNSKIPRCELAGKIEHGTQIMHNGIPITLGGYYGPQVTQMLFKNKGVHEPQEEYAFGVVLKEMKKGATMIELGCYWAFYSLWFLKSVENSKAYLVEPDKFNLNYGKNNFRINKVKGDFTNAFIGDMPSTGDVPYIKVSDLILKKKLDFVDIVHSDIQGFELNMLHDLTQVIKQQRVGYFFISTHSQEIHYNCINFLKENNYLIVCESDMEKSFSVDGLIVAKSPSYPGVDKIDISHKTVSI
jgi:hypothetical protein